MGWARTRDKIKREIKRVGDQAASLGKSVIGEGQAQAAVNNDMIAIVPVPNANEKPKEQPNNLPTVPCIALEPENKGDRSIKATSLAENIVDNNSTELINSRADHASTGSHILVEKKLFEKLINIIDRLEGPVGHILSTNDLSPNVTKNNQDPTVKTRLDDFNGNSVGERAIQKNRTFVAEDERLEASPNKEPITQVENMTLKYPERDVSGNVGQKINRPANPITKLQTENPANASKIEKRTIPQPTDQNKGDENNLGQSGKTSEIANVRHSNKGRPSTGGDPVKNIKGDMRREGNRLQTFAGWTIPYMRPQDMAATGFYYFGRGDEVRCAFCQVEIGFWEDGDDPVADHKKWKPDCPLLNRKPCGNIPLSRKNF